MTNVEKSSIRVTNDPTEPIRTTTPKQQENWTFPSGEDLWDGDDETQFSNPETSLIPESTTPKQESWDEFWNDNDETQFLNPETSTLLSSFIPESTTLKQESWMTASNVGWHKQKNKNSWIMDQGSSQVL